MALTAQTYGLIPAYHPTGQNRAREYDILNNNGTGYGTAIFFGDLVMLDSAGNGTVEIGDGSSNCLGVFAGCEYIDPTGRPVTSPNWNASTLVLAGSRIKCYVYDDPKTVFKVGVSANAASYVQTAVGDQVDIANNGTGSTLTGHSAASITAAPVGNGAGPAQVRIVGFVNGEIYNATTNPFPEVFVEIVQHQFNSGAGQAAV